MNPYDYLIIGSGLFGAMFAHFAKRSGKKCLVIDKRPHLGGNVYCESVEGINVHKYGAHIFHTSNHEVWDFVNGIAPFNRYTNCPVAKAKIEEQRAEAVAALKGREPANLEEQALSLVGKDIYEALIKGYTEKQWERPCTELPSFIIKRLPVRLVFDNNYFNDTYQGIPIGGYNKLIEGMLDGIETRTNCDFFAHRSELSAMAEKIVYTGQIDEFYDFRFGHLDFRTVSFEQETKDTPNWQGNAVVNYTEREVPYTRIIEHKHFEMFGQSVYDCPRTVISREYSTEWKPGMEPYYPVNDAKNNELYLKYKALADQETNVVFGCRLAEYKYYDMAPVIEQVMKMKDNI